MSFQKDHVILVNEKDEWVGTMEKLAAHRDGVLHRAFSVFVMNDKNEILIQQRADNKYHSGGLWSNTCCSHPLPGESTLSGAHRRLKEELGFDCQLEPLFHLRYKSEVGNELVENEYDYIYYGRYNGNVSPNMDEVKNYKFVSLHELEEWLNTQPNEFTTWFQIALPQFLASYKALLQAA